MVRVKDVMKRRPAPSAREDEPLEVAVRRMLEARIDALPVVDGEGTLVGLLSGADALDALSGQRPTGDPRIEQVMTPSPVTVTPDSTLGEAAGIMLERGFRHLPVVDAQSGELVAILSERDLRSALGAELRDIGEVPEEVLEDRVSSAMRPDPATVRLDTALHEVVELFVREGVGALPVLDENERLVGIVSYVDVLGWLRWPSPTAD